MRGKGAAISTGTAGGTGAPAAPGARGALEAWRRLIDLAARRLRGDGWQVEAVHHEPLADWHVAARRLGKWRVVQVLAPGTPPAARNERRIGLGQRVRLAAKLGTMEQWAAHVRPGGGIVFGAEVLYGAMWAGVAPDAELPWRLGLTAETTDTAQPARPAQTADLQ